MIYKFDHLSYITSRKRVNELIGDKPTLFKEIGLKNIGIKEQFMRYKQENHDLYFFESGVLGELPIEVIAYDNIANDTFVEVDGNIVRGGYKDKEAALQFLSILFPGKVEAKGDLLVCNMKGVMDKNDYYLELYPRLFDDVFLDSGGYGCVTLLTNSLYEFDDFGVTSNLEKVVVNERELIVRFAKADSINVFFELLRKA